MTRAPVVDDKGSRHPTSRHSQGTAATCNLTPKSCSLGRRVLRQNRALTKQHLPVTTKVVRCQPQCKGRFSNSGPCQSYIYPYTTLWQWAISNVHLQGCKASRGASRHWYCASWNGSPLPKTASPILSTASMYRYITGAITEPGSQANHWILVTSQIPYHNRNSQLHSISMLLSIGSANV